MLRKLSYLCVLSASAGCGTHVDSGQNVERAKESTSADAGADTDMGSSSGDPEADALTLKCFGEAEANADITTFCSNISADHRSKFSTVYRLLCEEKKLANLLNESCSWKGDAETVNRYFRVLKRTDLADTSTQEYYFLSAFAVTPKSSTDELLDLLFDGYSDPHFTDRYLTVPNTVFSDISTDRNAGQVDYKVQLYTSSSVASFRGHIDVVSMGNDLTVAYDYSVEGIQMIKSHRYFTIYKKVSAHETRMLVIDEKIIDDGGNHPLAYNTALSVDKKRMEIAYENALRD